MSFMLKLFFLSKFWIAGTGPMPIIFGSTPDTWKPTNLAKGSKLFALTVSSSAWIDKYY